MSKLVGYHVLPPVISWILFLLRDALCDVHCAVLLQYVVRPSVRPSVRDVDVPWPYKSGYTFIYKVITRLINSAGKGMGRCSQQKTRNSSETGKDIGSSRLLLMANRSCIRAFDWYQNQ